MIFFGVEIMKVGVMGLEVLCFIFRWCVRVLLLLMYVGLVELLIGFLIILFLLIIFEILIFMDYIVLICCI